MRWLAKPPWKISRLLPLIALIALAYGTRVPGWEHFATALGILILLPTVVATWVWAGALATLRSRGYSDNGASALFPAWSRRILVSIVIALALLWARPTMYLCFWISYPWLNRIATNITSQPFAQTPPYVNQYRGLYYVGDTLRCPHGVKIVVGSDHAGFFKRTDGGDCTRFDLGFPLGGGWYASE